MQLNWTSFLAQIIFTDPNRPSDPAPEIFASSPNFYFREQTDA